MSHLRIEFRIDLQLRILRKRRTSCLERMKHGQGKLSGGRPVGRPRKLLASTPTWLRDQMIVSALFTTTASANPSLPSGTENREQTTENRLFGISLRRRK